MNIRRITCFGNAVVSYTPNPGIQFLKNIFEAVLLIMKTNYSARLLQLYNVPCRLVLPAFLLNRAKLILQFIFIAIAFFL